MGRFKFIYCKSGFNRQQLALMYDYLVDSTVFNSNGFVEAYDGENVVSECDLITLYSPYYNIPESIFIKGDRFNNDGVDDYSYIEITDDADDRVKITTSCWTMMFDTHLLSDSLCRYHSTKNMKDVEKFLDYFVYFKDEKNESYKKVYDDMKRLFESSEKSSWFNKLITYEHLGVIDLSKYEIVIVDASHEKTFAHMHVEDFLG